MEAQDNDLKHMLLLIKFAKEKVYIDQQVMIRIRSILLGVNI